MSIAALELNDQSLLIQAEDGALHAEPGFARLTDEGIVTGEQARAVAWREPQHVYNQYWCQLNQAPLPTRHRHARHHADIAFAQLRELWQSAGSPQVLVLLAPGSFNDDQLSLLLGMAAALPCEVRAVIDSALAACAEEAGDTLYVDLQMHDAVLTVCRARGETVRVLEQEIFPGLGMAQVQNALARHVSDILIGSYRYDPLHSSEAEQAIYDQVPHWLARLCWEADVSVSLSTELGEYACILNRDAIRKQLGDRIGSLRSFLGKHRNCNLLLSHGSGLLRGLVNEFADAEAVDQSAAVQRCLARHEDLPAAEEGLHRLREMPRNDTGEDEPPANGQRPATHLLCGDLALPLRKPVSIRIGGEGPRLSAEYDEESALTVVLRNDRLEALHVAAEVTLPGSCRPGESIRVEGHELRLIRVRGD